MKQIGLLMILLLSLFATAIADNPILLRENLDKLRKVDHQIDAEVKTVVKKLNNDQMTIADAHAAWSKLLERAEQNIEAVRSLQHDGDIRELAMMQDLVRMQRGRVQLLVTGSKIEIEKGLKEAEETYGWQEESSQRYFECRRLVDEIFETKSD